MAAFALLFLSILAGCREESTYPDYAFALACLIGAVLFIVADAAASRVAKADEQGGDSRGQE